MGIKTLSKVISQYQIEKKIINGSKQPSDWIEFAGKCRIRSGNVFIPFIPYDYQRKLCQLIDQHRGVIVFKTRQTGITETISNKFLHKASQNPAYFGAIFSLNQKKTSAIAQRTRLMAGPAGIEFTANSLTEQEVAGGGRLLFLPSTENAGRSLESLCDLFLDEAEFPPKIEEIYSTASPAQEMVGADARTVIVSTPGSRSSWYWQMFDSDNGDIDAEETRLKILAGELPPFYHWVDRNGWAKVFIHWKAHPIYSQQPDYLEQTKAKYKLTDSRLQREFNFGLTDALNAVFDIDLIKACGTGEWMPAFRNRTYIAGIDPNFSGDDFWVCQIWDVTEIPYQLVATFKANRRTKEYSIANTLELLDHYQPAVVGIETNGGGQLILEELINERPHYNFRGVVTTNQSKLVNTDRLVLLSEKGVLKVPVDSDFLSECRHFVEEFKGSTRIRKAENKYHDDEIMAGAIAFSCLSDIGISTFEIGTVTW